MKNNIKSIGLWTIVLIEITLSFPLSSEPSLGIEFDLYSPTGLELSADKINNSSYNYIRGNFVVRLENELGISPIVKLGLANVQSDVKKDDNLKHLFYSAMGGAALYHDLNLFLGLSLDLSIGLGVAHFYQFDTGLYFESNFIAEISGNFLCRLSPSFQLRVTPKLLFRKTFFNLTNFDNLLWGLGASLSYIPGEINRKILPVKMDAIQIDPLFVGMKNHYTLDNTTVGSVVLENRGNEVIRDLKVYLAQRTLMDSPTLCYSYNSLEPGSKILIPLKVNLNKNAFFYKGETVLNGEIQLTYVYKQNIEEQYKNIRFKLYDQNTIQWNDTQKIGAYISGTDKGVMTLASQINNKSTISEESPLSSFWESAEVFNILKIMGIKYKKDPQPMVIKQNDLLIPLDHINFPGETMGNLAGDCDDLTVLFCSIMEARGIETAVISLPGHILPLVNLGLGSKEAYLFEGWSGNKVFHHKGQLWLLVEITNLNQGDFLQAWRAASSQLEGYRGPIITIANAHLNYPEINQPDVANESMMLNQNKYIAAANETIKIKKNFSQLLLNHLQENAYNKPTVEGFDQWGKAALLLENYDEAFKAYDELSNIEPGNIRGLLCLGLVCSFMEQKQEALNYLKQALEELTIQQMRDIWVYRSIFIKMSLLYHELGDDSQADFYSMKADEIINEEQYLPKASYLKGNKHSRTQFNNEWLKELLL